ncbi:MAG: hypothetical protein JO004_02245 [Methylobacteriaceae bacterium]|nr:hypothetical protein [Methylobacteriaceae bacterium]
MMKLVLAGSAALMLGLGSAYAAPIRAPALGEAIDSQTTQAMMEHRSMDRMMHHRMHHRRMMMHHRGMMMRRHHMHRRMMHHM